MPQGVTMTSNTERAKRLGRRPRRPALIAVSAALSALTLAACGTSSGGSSANNTGTPSGPVTLTWYTEPVNTTPVVKDLITAFEKNNPNIKIKLVVGPSDIDTVRGTLAT